MRGGTGGGVEAQGEVYRRMEAQRCLWGVGRTKLSYNSNK